MSRRTARESTFKFLYGLEFGKDESIDEQLEMYIDNQLDAELKDAEKQYLIEVAHGVQNNKKLIDNTIKKYLKGWKITRISKIDLAILRLAIYEMFMRDDIPVGVAINEAVELAKTYGTKESGSFVNGVLGEAAKQKNDSGK